MMMTLDDDTNAFDTISSKLQQSISQIFIDKLFDTTSFNRAKNLSLLDDISSHSSVSFSLIVAPHILRHLSQNSEPLSELLKDNGFACGLVKLCSTLLESRNIYQFEDSDYIKILESTSTVLKTLHDGVYPIKTSSLLKDCKKQFGESFLQFFFRCTYAEIKSPSEGLEGIRVCCSSIMLNPALYGKTLSNESLLNLIVILFKNLVINESEISTIAVNCIRMLVMNQSSIQNVTNALKVDDVKINARFQEILKNCLSLNDEDFKSQLYMDTELKNTLNKKFGDSLEILQKLENKPTKSEAVAEIVKRHGFDSREKFNKLIKNEIEPLTKLIIKSETKRFHRHIQDDKDDLSYYINIYTNIKNKLPVENMPFKWVLDSTEGPNRMRKRIIRESLSPEDGLTFNTETANGAQASNDAFVMVDNEDINGSFDMVSDLQPEFESFEEDKHRKILRSLFVGDKISGLTNVTQIHGLETVESILISGVTHLVMQ
ncbi:unnamed protein product [Ambrosiozyma monospora]|uniref:Unnamed protein product n=1 Tax=Ambrosiozyma monospora TaxID=43982 RepID=A0ACB5T2L9_AMBMO|nr:unnamed protein product [Ambrosiozyma monospora]